MLSCLIHSIRVSLSSFCFYLCVLAFPFFRRKALCEKRRHQLLLEFKESLSILSSFLSAGYSTENAFRASIPELRSLFSDKAMIVQEFEAIAHGLRLNRTIEELLSDFAYRSGLDDIANFAEIFTVAKIPAAGSSRSSSTRLV